MLSIRLIYNDFGCLKSSAKRQSTGNYKWDSAILSSPSLISYSFLQYANMYTVYVLEGAIWRVGSLFVVCKGQKLWFSSILPKKTPKWNSLSWVEKMLRIVSFVRFGKIVGTINCFGDLLTFGIEIVYKQTNFTSIYLCCTFPKGQ